MKYLPYFLVIAALIFSSCNDEEPIDPMPEAVQLSTQLSLSLDGNQVDLVFDCDEQPGLYSSGSRTDVITGKFIFDQGYLRIPLTATQTMILNTIIYTEMDIRQMDLSDLATFIGAHPETFHIDIAIEEGSRTYKNVFYEPSEFEERNNVAENEAIQYSFGSVNSFDCLDNTNTIELDFNYAAILKEENMNDQKEIDASFQIHMRSWR